MNERKKIFFQVYCFQVGMDENKTVFIDLVKSHYFKYFNVSFVLQPLCNLDVALFQGPADECEVIASHPMLGLGIRLV